MSFTDEVAERRVNNAQVNPVYIGRARVGTLETADLWQIQYLEYDSGNDLASRKWAVNGVTASTDFEFIWAGDEVVISGITQANPAVVSATAHGFSNGDKVIITEVVGMTEVNFDGLLANVYTVASATTNTFALSGVNSSGYTAYSSGGVVRYFNAANYNYL
jgi:hypothetical protein